MSDKKLHIIGVGGPSCGGKSTACQIISDKFKNNRIAVLSQDRYYKTGGFNGNYDVPDAINFDGLIAAVISLSRGKKTPISDYNFSTHTSLGLTDEIDPHNVDVLIVEGILILYVKRLYDLFDLKVYVNAQREIRYERRLNRDMSTRGRTLEEIKEQYFRDVLPSNQHYVEPTMWNADIALMNNKDGSFVGLDILMNHIKQLVDN